MTLRWLRVFLLAGAAAGGLTVGAFAQGAADGEAVRIVPIAGTPSTASPTGSEVPIESTAQAGPAIPAPSSGVPDSTSPTTTMPNGSAPRGTPGTMPGSAGPGSTGPGSAQPGIAQPGTGASERGATVPGNAAPGGVTGRDIPPPGANPDVPSRHTTGAPPDGMQGAAGTRQRQRATQQGDRWACHNVKLAYASPNPDGSLSVALQNTNDRPVRVRAEFRADGYRPAASEPETIPPGEIQEFTVPGVGGGLDDQFAYGHTRPAGCAFSRMR